MKVFCSMQYQEMINRYQAQDLSASEFIQWARAWPEVALKSWPLEHLALRQAYQELWMDLMDRFESSALFTEESCSFSQTDLILSMDKWVKKVDAYIAKS